MAKSTMALGQYRGKMGGLVFRKGFNGQQIVQAYQPVVKNPRSDAQLMQRAKFNLAQQIARQVPLSFIYSLGNSSVERRGAFVSNIIKAATASKTVVDNKEAYRANIDGASVVISRGVSAALMSPMASWDAAGHEILVQWSDISGQQGWTGGEQVSLLIGVFSVDGSKEPTFFTVEDAGVISTRQTTWYIPTSLTGSNQKAMVWVFVTRQGANVTSATGTGTSVPGNDIVASLTLGTGVANLEYSDSMFAGVFALEG